MEQLVEGGVLVLPLRLNGAHVCLALRKRGQELVGRRAAVCGFMPLRGAFGPVYARRLASDPSLRASLLVSGDTPLKGKTFSALEPLLRDARQVKIAFPRGRDRRNTPLYYLVLQGRPVLLILRRTEGRDLAPFALLTSPRSAIALPWQRPRRGRLTLYGSDEALEFLQDTLSRWQAEGRPDLRDLRVRVRPSRARLGPLPRRVDGRYRFRRGEHLYELWFER